MANAAYSAKSGVDKKLQEAGKGGYRQEVAYFATWLRGPEVERYSPEDLRRIKRVVDKLAEETETLTFMGPQDSFPSQMNYIRERINRLVPGAYSRDVKEDTKSMDFPKARRYFLENLREAKRGGSVAGLEALAKNVHPILSQSRSRSGLGGLDLERQQRTLEKLTFKTLGNAYLKEAEKNSDHEAALKNLRRAAELFGKIGDDKGVDKVNKMGISISVETLPEFQEARKLKSLGEYGAAAACYRKAVLDKKIPEPVKVYAREEIKSLHLKIKRASEQV